MGSDPFPVIRPFLHFLLELFLFFPLVSASGQVSGRDHLDVVPDSAHGIISRHIFGQFSEHLGRCVYEGIWVGEKSPIPNTRGIRNDVVAALKHIRIPNLRWPGGCFADEYHWMNGIGPRDRRPKSVNTTWGGVVEENSFGTHEFMDLCGQLGCEPVICGNIGSGTVKEMSDWAEYLTSNGPTAMAELRRSNGRELPWNITYWAVGNETWGCGGIMSAEFYSTEFARYSYFLKTAPNPLFKIASGGHEDDYAWTEAMMKKWSGADGWLQGFMGGYSLHYYTVCHDWNKKGSATEFNEIDWFTTISKTLRMDTLIARHSAVMDKYDPAKKIALVVDEWGNWHDVEPGTNPAFLYQQNTLRDAIVAALNLNIFIKHSDRVRMANIAQLANVLHSLLLTDNGKLILTPTYEVFDLYKVHQDATFLPVPLTSQEYTLGGRAIPALDAVASVDTSGTVHISIVNVDHAKNISLTCSMKGVATGRVNARVLTSSRMQDHNTFEAPRKVELRDFRSFTVRGDQIIVDVPAKSVLMLEIRK